MLQKEHWLELVQSIAATGDDHGSPSRPLNEGWICALQQYGTDTPPTEAPHV